MVGREMKERVQITKNKDELKIEILPKYNHNKQILLWIWLIPWTLCGLAVFSQLFGNYDIQTKFFFILYLLFWLFFEWKVIYAIRWRKNGKEIITIKDNNLIIEKEINGKGLTQVFDIDKINNLRFFEEKENSMTQLFGNAYWMIAGYGLAFDYDGKTIPFGIETDDKTRKKIVFEINRFLTDKKKSR